jgi:putative ABC transport system ATP-binding protein
VNALLETRDVAFAFRDGAEVRPVLRDVSLTLRSGEFVGLIGPSGSGKSSLLFLLAGLRRPDRGEVRVQGEPWPEHPGVRADRRRRRLGLVLQEPFLLPHLTVLENALVQAVDEAAAARIPELAATLGIEHRLDGWPHQISTGERQRASVVRALANAPALVLADEPTAHLDHAAGAQVIELHARCARDAGLIVATHDARMLAAADRVLRIVDGTVL